VADDAIWQLASEGDREQELPKAGVGERMRMLGNLSVSENNWQSVRLRAAGGTLRLTESRYCPEFGIRLVRPCLEIAFAPGSEATLELTW
jgi:hypothetical protein